MPIRISRNTVSCLFGVPPFLGGAALSRGTCSHKEGDHRCQWEARVIFLERSLAVISNLWEAFGSGGGAS